MPYHNFFVSITHLFCEHYASITIQAYLRAQPPLRKSSPLAPYFPTFSAELKRKDNLRLISLHSLLNLNVGIPVALPSLFPYIKC